MQVGLVLERTLVHSNKRYIAKFNATSSMCAGVNIHLKQRQWSNLSKMPDGYIKVYS